ncbi:PIN domain-containing protein [Roseovarius sp. B08]|uniref:PIN domain-containing protein n=1 Tax=Roseovarius sp. B08 TaxID=3449223 RepID=UPI003EDBF207
MTKGETDGSRQRAAIEAAFPEALVTGYEMFEDKIALPDPNDNHVLAAAIATSASVIVTDNLADFPSAVLDPHAIQAISADDFIADTIELDPSGGHSGPASHAGALQEPGARCCGFDSQVRSAGPIAGCNFHGRVSVVPVRRRPVDAIAETRSTIGDCGRL